MSESETLYKLFKGTDQLNMIAKLKDSNAELLNNVVKTCGPNTDYPQPWNIVKFPGLDLCSIISSGSEPFFIDNTVISMISIKDAERVLEEIK